MELYDRVLCHIEEVNNAVLNVKDLKLVINITPSGSQDSKGSTITISFLIKPVKLKYNVYQHISAFLLENKGSTIKQDGKLVNIDNLSPMMIENTITLGVIELFYQEKVIRYQYRDDSWHMIYYNKLIFENCLSKIDRLILRDEILRMPRVEENPSKYMTMVDSYSLGTNLFHALKITDRCRVYLLDQDNVIKIYPNDICGLREFLVELDTMSRLTHPHLMQVKKVLYCDMKTCFVNAIITEYAPITIYEKVKNGLNAYSLQERIANIYQLGSALELLHSEGIAHCDINFRQVVFDKNNKIKLIDYGAVEYFDLEEPNKFKHELNYYYSWRESDNKIHGAASDILALAYVMIDIILGRAYLCESKIKLSTDDVKRFDYIKSLINTDDLLTDLLSRMTNPDWGKRLSIDNVVNHQVFAHYKPLPSLSKSHIGKGLINSEHDKYWTMKSVIDENKHIGIEVLNSMVGRLELNSFDNDYFCMLSAIMIHCLLTRTKFDRYHQMNRDEKSLIHGYAIRIAQAFNGQLK